MIPEKLQEIMKTDGVVAIATLGPDGPHLVNTWNSYLRIAPDGRLFIPAGYMHKTEANINHNPELLDRFGPDMGADIPAAAELTHNLKPLLDRFGNDPRLRLILFTLDESTYARELAPLAGHYPALWVGPPWWFNDSLSGIARYLDQVVETAGLHNTAGFNDDTRAFCSIPVRHDVWRRASCNWLAGLVLRGIVGTPDAREMAREMAHGLAKRAYRLG